MLERDSAIAPKAATASTDLLHRRILLAYSFQIVLGEFSVRIETDSALMDKALYSLNLPADLTGREALGKWEIAVETYGESKASLSHGTATELIEVHRFGPSCAIRLSSGSWFAHTPPSLNGVGFAMVAGNERDQIDQLAVYLRAVVSFIDEDGARSDPDLALEVCA
ncbi:MAG: hypothetical protein WAN35_03920 [Terracidiphilus sp.]